ncbi:uncharacterized protein LACBIDRAFT_297545 [Laccaria bicolor S238N-H82]|uniref:Predicted protein n=1 Tax=Laccaria bicolor (strain S238N-H82 / ATCC MYA-4686) TaxID=486041 RepID=B0DBF3_LACBS|nr:uncharacterized protein LACBIDRAFT_297545 [Laccaria bicolor S238N-H82]EDR08179.1 predicted protein [Laccaria bicolor S238N-H82]|eukprot:XP_001881249.1 predicted protein [Laccaria bicolor S238N-H82]
MVPLLVLNFTLLLHIYSLLDREILAEMSRPSTYVTHVSLHIRRSFVTCGRHACFSS